MTDLGNEALFIKRGVTDIHTYSYITHFISIYCQFLLRGSLVVRKSNEVIMLNMPQMQTSSCWVLFAFALAHHPAQAHSRCCCSMQLVGQRLTWVCPKV